MALLMQLKDYFNKTILSSAPAIKKSIIRT